MSEIEHTLEAARDKWVSTAIAQQMIRSVAPPTAEADETARLLLEAGRLSGGILLREIPGELNWRSRQIAKREGTLPQPRREWNLESLILRLLTVRIAASWAVSEATILRLATIRNDQLPAFELEQIIERGKASQTGKTIATEMPLLRLQHPIQSGKRTDAEVAVNTVQSNIDSSAEIANEQGRLKISYTAHDEADHYNKKTKATGRPIDPLWAQVLGHAAGWLAQHPGGTPTRGELQKVIDGRFHQLSSDPPDTSTTKKYARQMLDAFKKFVEAE